jgi:hypothetical protein
MFKMPLDLLDDEVQHLMCCGFSQALAIPSSLHTCINIHKPVNRHFYLLEDDALNFYFLHHIFDDNVVNIHVIRHLQI